MAKETDNRTVKEKIDATWRALAVHVVNRDLDRVRVCYFALKGLNKKLSTSDLEYEPIPEDNMSIDDIIN